MKKDLTKHSLRDQLDALPFEFEEAHWDNLGSRLHANGGTVLEKEQSTGAKISRLGLLLLLGLLAGVMVVYFGKNEAAISPDQSPAAPQQETKITSPTASNKSLPIQENDESKENNTAVQQKIEKSKTAIRPSSQKENTKQKTKQTIAKTIPTADAPPALSTNTPAKPNTPMAQNTENNKNTSADIFSNQSTKPASQKIKPSRIKLQANALSARAIQPVSLNQHSTYSKIGQLKLNQKKERKNRWGVVSGFNFSNGKPGLFLGLSYQRTLKSPWYLETGMIYRGSNVKTWNIDPSNIHSQNDAFNVFEVEIHSLRTLQYIDFPLLVKWKPIKQFSLEAGPKLGVLTAATGKVTYHTVIDPTIEPQEIESRMLNNSTFGAHRIKSLRKLELGAVIGATWHLDDHLGIGLRSHFGLNTFSDRNIIGPSPQKRNLDIQFLIQLYL